MALTVLCTLYQCSEVKAQPALWVPIGWCVKRWVWGDHSWRFAYRAWSKIESTFLLVCWIVWIFYLLQKITFHYSAGVLKLHTWLSSENVNGVIYRQSVVCTSEIILYHYSLVVYPKCCVHNYKSVIIWHIQSLCRVHSQYIYTYHVDCHIVVDCVGSGQF